MMRPEYTFVCRRMHRMQGLMFLVLIFSIFGFDFDLPFFFRPCLWIVIAGTEKACSVARGVQFRVVILRTGEKKK